MEPAAPPTERAFVHAIRGNPGTTLGGEHPPFTARFHNHQSPSQREELATCVTMPGCPILSRTPLEGKCEYWDVALGEATQFFNILGN
jgi:hypothetical protein